MKLDREASKKTGVTVMRTSAKTAMQKGNFKEEKKSSKKNKEESEESRLESDFMRDE